MYICAPEAVLLYNQLVTFLLDSWETSRTPLLPSDAFLPAFKFSQQGWCDTTAQTLSMLTGPTQHMAGIQHFDTTNFGLYQQET